MIMKMTTRLTCASTLLTMLAVGWAAAHEGHAHTAQGTVKAVSAEQLDLAREEGKVESFVLRTDTKYRRGEAVEKREAIQVGERAVVRYVEQEGKKVAKEVRLAEKG